MAPRSSSARGIGVEPGFGMLTDRFGVTLFRPEATVSWVKPRGSMCAAAIAASLRR